MSIKKAYYYFFYKFYKFGERSLSTLPSNYTAAVAIGVLEVLFWLALKFFYIEFVDQNNSYQLLALQTLIPLGIIITVNCTAFLFTAGWKKYVSEFDQWPRSKNIIGTWVVAGIVLFIIVNIIVAVNVMSQVGGMH